MFCHLTVVQASGHETLPQGATVTREIAQAAKGPQVSRILAVDDPAGWAGAGANCLDHRQDPDPAWQDGGPTGVMVEVQGTVKFYHPDRRCGFVLPDEGGQEAFVHMSALSRSGLDELQPGKRVSVWAEEAPRGRRAREIMLV